MLTISADVIFLADRVRQLESEMRKKSPWSFPVFQGSDQVVDANRRKS